MKFAFAATAALLFCVPARAELVEYWAQGVSRERGWTNTFQFRNGCWAAVASNMVDWWQQRIEAKYGAGGKYIDPETLNTRYDTNPYFKSGGDYIWKAIDWYLKETYPAIVNTRPDLWNYYLTEGDTNPPRLAQQWTRSRSERAYDVFHERKLRRGAHERQSHVDALRHAGGHGHGKNHESLGNGFRAQRQNEYEKATARVQRRLFKYASMGRPAHFQPRNLRSGKQFMGTTKYRGDGNHISQLRGQVSRGRERSFRLPARRSRAFGVRAACGNAGARPRGNAPSKKNGERLT